MARGKFEIKKIEKASKRNVTFSKRQRGLMKKARELSILCSAEIGVIVFSDAGKLYEFASSSMNEVLTRYNNCLVANEIPDSGEVAALKEEIRQLKQKQMQLMGKELDGLGLKEIEELEELLAAGLLSMKQRKEQLETQDQPERSIIKEVRRFPGTPGISGPNIATIKGAEYVKMTRESQLRAGPLFHHNQPKRKVAERSPSSTPAVEVRQPAPEVEGRELPKEKVSTPMVDNTHQRPKRERRLPKALMDYDM